jgi:GH24 family phage-related lysozyme (muramidase)
MNEDKHLSPAGETFIKGEEDDGGKPVLKSYDDGTGTWTGPWGTTHGVKPHQTFTLEQAQVLFDVEILDIESGMRAWLTREITQGLWDALCSFGYNNGWGRCGTLKTAVNSGDWAKTQAAFMLFVHAYNEHTGRTEVWPGLVKRRKDELALWYKVDKDIGPQTEAQREAAHIDDIRAKLNPMGPGLALPPPKPNIVVTAAKSRSIWAQLSGGAAMMFYELRDSLNGLFHFPIPPADGVQGLVDQTQSSINTGQQVAGWFHFNSEHLVAFIVLGVIAYTIIRRALDKQEQVL